MGKKLGEPDIGFRWYTATQAAFPQTNPQDRPTVDINGVPYVDVHGGMDFENPSFDESKHYLWPIPLSVLAQNPDIGQNPGW